MGNYSGVLPKVRGLSADQQARLDEELTARNLITLGQMRLRSSEVVAALQSALAVDATAIFAAYGDLEAETKQRKLDAASVKAVNATIETVPEQRVRSARRPMRVSDKDEEA